jgi:acetoin utilization deacetylase AcuC-like enzyme
MKTFYNDNMSVKDNKSFSPSAAKPSLFLEYLSAKKVPVELISNFEPCTKDKFKIAHQDSFVDGVLDLNIQNGFGNYSKKVADSLLYTTGSFLACAQYSFINKRISFSPTSGFHHASYAYASGFCTFNGLIVSAMILRKQYPTIKIGIIDCDQHYGDGTEMLIKHHQLDFIQHYTYGAKRYLFKNGSKWLKSFDEAINQFSDVDIIFYQAGADPHVNDPLGGTLTTNEMIERDILLFTWGVGHQIPVVWNLAGGYCRIS